MSTTHMATLVALWVVDSTSTIMMSGERNVVSKEKRRREEFALKRPEASSVSKIARS